MKMMCGILGLCLFTTAVNGQNPFVYSGRIEFERKINVKKQIDVDPNDPLLKQLMDQLPSMHSSTFILRFDSTASLYEFAGTNSDGGAEAFLGPAKQNYVYKDFSTVISKKKVGSELYVIEDKPRKNFYWKLNDEPRVIAGLECKKAVGRICDSVYVVAFYAEEIPVSGGPESFGGLPGMILGLVIPRLYTSWFATRIVLEDFNKANAVSIQRSSRISTDKFRQIIYSRVGEGTKITARDLWWLAL